ncbi:MAG: PDDEXK nuclease domain-containing protein [Candidatus Melainabacteria bacterium]|nr:MAG: PDDEXK nuclease domain-containing protein [Candidatus Melainabacteria bacterium]
MQEQKTYHVVNSIMVETYWKIGHRIVEEEQAGKSRAEYGTKLIENLSKYLTDTFGKGFSEANLKNMRQFYLAFPKFDTQCVANLSWTNIRTIIRISDKKEREYYLKEAAVGNWTSRQLERNIKSGYYQRLLSTQENNDNICLPAVINPKDFVKDPYVLEFLDLPENIEGKESTLESALITNLQKFLLEQGKGFFFFAKKIKKKKKKIKIFFCFIIFKF